jgi:HEAT repeat protein
MRRAATLVLALLAGAARPAGGAPSPLDEALRLTASRKWEERLQGLEALEKAGKDAKAEKAAIATLLDSDWGVAMRAAQTAAAVGGEDAAVALAETAFRGEIQWLRDAAVDAVKGLDARRAVARLLHAVKVEKEERDRTRAIEALGRLAGPEEWKKLRALSRAKEPVLAAAAVRALGRVAAAHPTVHEDVLELLGEALDGRADKDLFLSYAAAVEGLAGIASPAARRMLVEELLLLPDDDAYAPERIARALAPVPGKELADLLRPAFEKAAKAPAPARRLARLCARLRLREARPEVEALLLHREPRVRSEAVRALGLLGDPAGARAVQGVLGDAAPVVRVEAAIALARLVPATEYRDLASRLVADEHEEVRLQAVVELSDLGEPAAIPVLERLVGDASWRVASAAIATIGTLGVAEDLPRIEAATRHKAWQIRAAAFEGLGRLRAAQAIPLLIEGLLDKDPVVRGTCHANLQILTNRKAGPETKTWRAWWDREGKDLVLLKRSRGQKPVEVREDVVSPGDGRYVPDSRRTYTRKRGVEVLQKARILVVSGAWDKVEKVLGHLSIPHTLLRAQEIKNAGINPNQVVLVNCEGNVDKDAAQRLRWFVNVGGYLMATDWAVTKAINDCFPGYLRQFSGASTGNDVVVVEDASPGHPLTRGVFESVPALMWWLEIQAFPLSITYPERVEVLVDSAQMRHRYGSSPAAATFRWGLGKVQHSVSHFYLQEEGLVKAQGGRDRMIFAADNLGLSIEQIRKMADEGRFEGQITEETMKELAPDYSMFRMIVNVVREKSDWVEGL